ncbi:sensor domain-containing diguanylate cyclase [Guyparkeria halophila]|uniref:Sensor domain-containing diguanylate cyclase n=1 Tax=Guyparkeria halophila TaxID=47960 RepID=A0ABZ0YXN5_9GAMM|nr:sensor domain-containing diguanylate cyclase [Guyparkeria halophila]WQH16776.1 sensor domain-containing diguanylate cyclase [Guyparkeria halophila]
MRELAAIRLIRRKAMLLAVLGVFVSGILVAVVTAVPMYQSARDGLERSTLMGIQAQGAALDNLVQRYEGVARQVTSRTEIRRRLESYVDGELSLDRLVAFTQSHVSDAVDSSPALVGIKRLGPFGEVIVDAGAGEMPGLSMLVELDDIESRLVRSGDRIIWRTLSPIRDDQGRRLGTDVLFFEVDSLVRLLNRARVLEPSARGFLLDRAGGRVVGVDALDEGLVMSSASEVLTGDLSRVDPARSGVVWPDLDSQGGVLFYTPVGGGRCLLLVEVGFWAFYQPVIMRLLWPLGLVFLLLPIVAWLTARALRPVLQRLTEQSEELEHSAGEIRLAASVFEGTGEAVMITSPNHRVLRVNPAFTRITGFEGDEVVGRPMTDLFQLDESDSERLEAICSRLGRDHSWEGEMDYRNRQGERMTALQTISQVADDQGRVSHYIHIFNDITESKAAQRQIRHQARHDALTDLPNRASMWFCIEQAVEGARADGGRVAVLFLDLDYFKEVNDRLGHAMGDRLLREVAERLRRLLRHEDIVGRLGGDEFLILLEGLPAPRFAGQVAHKVIEALTQPFEIEGESIQIGVSIGIAVFPGQAADADGLIGHADSAMYEAKAAGRDTYRYFDRGVGATAGD